MLVKIDNLLLVVVLLLLQVDGKDIDETLGLNATLLEEEVVVEDLVDQIVVAKGLLDGF